MDQIDLVREIGDGVCEGCNKDRDCGLEYDECDRILNAVALLDQYNQEEAKGTKCKDTKCRSWAAPAEECPEYTNEGLCLLRCR